MWSRLLAFLLGVASGSGLTFVVLEELGAMPELTSRMGGEDPSFSELRVEGEAIGEVELDTLTETKASANDALGEAP